MKSTAFFIVFEGLSIGENKIKANTSFNLYLTTTFASLQILTPLTDTIYLREITYYL